MPIDFSLEQFVKRFGATWRDLFVKPSDFFRVSLESKRRSYLPAWQFYVTSFTIISVVSSASSYGTYWVQDPEAPLPNLLSYVMPGKVDPFVWAAQIVLSCVFWFLVAHKSLGLKARVTTPSLFRRLFVELLYFHSGPAELVPYLAVFLVLPVVWFAIAFVLGPSVKLLGEDFGILEFLWCAGLLGVLLLLVVVPFIIALIYTYVFARAMFVVKRLPSLALASCSAAIVPVIYICAVLFFVVVHPQQLSFEERNTVDFLRAAAEIEGMYEQKNHGYCDLKQLLTFVGSFSELQGAVSGHSAELTLLKETRADSLSHKLAFQLTKHGGYLHALPKSESDAGAWSYLINFRDLAVRGCKCEGKRANLFDRVVSPF